jgi:sialate O-acetylesterase
MHSTMRTTALVPSLLLAIATLPLAAAELRLPAVFTDHGVLQRDRSLPVWGWADAGTTVTVSFDGATATATAGTDGRWSARLPAHPAGGPYQLAVSTAAGASRTVSDLLVGEVWVCSGQSNMQMTVKSSDNAEQEIATADHPRIRLLTVPRIAKPEPVDDVQADWKVCSSDSVGTFSAAGYFFGRELEKTLAVPIGLIDSSWGGTPAEAWTQMAWLERDAVLKPIAERWTDASKPANKEAYEKKQKEWQERSEFEDPGLAEAAKGWMAPGLTLDGEWKELALPGAIEAAGLQINGGIWFRKEVAIPAGWAGKELLLRLGAIDDFDTTWFDGQEVGSTGNQKPGWWTQNREYRVPATQVKEGRAVIAVRVWDRYLTGGFVGSAAQMTLAPVDAPTAAVSLAGAWQYRIEVSKPEPTERPPVNPSALHNAPGHLWHSMMRPLVPYGIRGAIWYQGESNAGRAQQYRTLLPAMIDSWRSAWAQGDLPFYIVSLANFRDRVEQPRENDWAELREAQDLTARSVRQAGLALAIDIGDIKDIHPKNKQEVGHRLALQALRQTYGKDIAAQGPVLAECVIDGAEVRLRFAELGGGLATSDGKPPRGFALAGADHVFQWAEQARIDGAWVVLKAASVPEPVAARYGWDINPDVNLMNQAGLPAVPFRTDGWAMTTDGRR